MNLIKLIANLGYGSRKEVGALFRDGRVTTASGMEIDADANVDHADIHIDGEALDPPAGLIVMLHKPTGYTCSTADAGRLVYQLLPPRFRWRKPLLAPIGRLDRDTSGLLLFTDDGALLHRITSPRSHLAKVYEAQLAQDLAGTETEMFASGTLLLKDETRPLAPATLVVLGPRHVRLTIVEGRYHQIRRMFAAVGNHVETLHRVSVGGLSLDGLASGGWRVIDQADVARIFS
jgi:16S rRNA pseudouridine516 synthase